MNMNNFNMLFQFKEEIPESYFTENDTNAKVAVQTWVKLATQKLNNENVNRRDLKDDDIVRKILEFTPNFKVDNLTYEEKINEKKIKKKQEEFEKEKKNFVPNMKELLVEGCTEEEAKYIIEEEEERYNDMWDLHREDYDDEEIEFIQKYDISTFMKGKDARVLGLVY